MRMCHIGIQRRARRDESMLGSGAVSKEVSDCGLFWSVIGCRCRQTQAQVMWRACCHKRVSAFQTDIVDGYLAQGGGWICCLHRRRASSRSVEVDMSVQRVHGASTGPNGS